MSAMPQNQLQAQSLTCRRGRKLVFQDINLTLNAGSILLVQGPNGSGKSSLLRVLAGLLPLHQGVMTWQGGPIDDDPAAYRRDLCYIGHLDAIKPDLTIAETLDYWQALAGETQVIAPADPFAISALSSRPTRFLSAGQKRRLALSRLTTHTKKLWLLDEPATALDRAGQDILNNLIAAHAAAGGIAVIATHHESDFPAASVLHMKGQGA
jgi:heme exporter protein A